MKNMEFSRKNLEALKNRVAVVALATVVAFMGTGCGKEKTDDYFKSFLDDLIYTLVFWLIAFVITIFAF